MTALIFAVKAIYHKTDRSDLPEESIKFSCEPVRTRCFADLIPLLLTSLRSALLLHCLLKVLRSGEPKQKCLQLSVSNEIFFDLYLTDRKAFFLLQCLLSVRKTEPSLFMVIIIMYLLF